MNKINQTTFIYQIRNNTCFIQEPNWPLQELTIKGATDYQGIINGTWFQVDHLTNHWISFRKNSLMLINEKYFINALAMVKLNTTSYISWS
jgi:hypothetical protein